mmetsp:Transcript_40931/g.130066  ORF Transcript_40931/g.130066 Transcript_40931/m.130066 type:complete len:202 (+) Transcript_40931:1468-2073(+)
MTRTQSAWKRPEVTIEFNRPERVGSLMLSHHPANSWQGMQRSSLSDILSSRSKALSSSLTCSVGLRLLTRSMPFSHLCSASSKPEMLGCFDACRPDFVDFKDVSLLTPRPCCCASEFMLWYCEGCGPTSLWLLAASLARACTRMMSSRKPATRNSCSCRCRCEDSWRCFESFCHSRRSGSSSRSRLRLMAPQPGRGGLPQG